MSTDPSALLERVIPFSMLSRARREALAARLDHRVLSDGERLFSVGDAALEVYLLASGGIAVIDAADPPTVLSVATAGQYFGEQAVLFERPRRFGARAAGEVELFALDAAAFLALVDEDAVFAQALAAALRDKHGIFARYRRVYARILSLLDSRGFLLSDLVDAYEQLRPALHPGLDSPRIDTGALAYAVARLPQGVAGTTFYYLCSTLPELYRQPDDKFEAVPTRARRRSSWRLIEGKLLCLLRDGISDVSDLLTCLCLYSVEARKIRRRLRSADTLRSLKQLRDQPDGAAATALMDGFPLSAEERKGLLGIWPQSWPAELRNLLLHHEDIGVECDLVALDYNASAAEEWASQVREAASRVVDLEDPDLEVHIISSNTHSVSNCLSSYLGRCSEEIMDWGRMNRPELVADSTWTNERDLLYVLARELERAQPQARARRIDEERASGHERLAETAFTGITVDLIDARQLRPELTDPAVRLLRPQRPTLIVNVDYAFGQQAESVLANLLYLFGRRLRSLNVLGKAGGLVGNRGDILLATATLLQTNDEVYPVEHGDLGAELLAELAPGRGVHQGPVLTVAGTLLQDSTLLHYYRRFHRCVGLEMEGSFFLRQLRSAMAAGIVSPAVVSRFAYYVSDLPLSPHHNLSASLSPWEGVPPLYAITRAILRRIAGAAASS